VSDHPRLTSSARLVPVQHTAQRHAGDAESRSSLADAQAELGEHILADDLALLVTALPRATVTLPAAA